MAGVWCRGFRSLSKHKVLSPNRSRCIQRNTPIPWATASSLCHGRGISSDISGVSPSHVGFNDYESEKRNFRWQKPEYFNFASDVIDNWAAEERRGNRSGPAFWWIDDQGNELQWTFCDIQEKSKRVANMLVGPCGVKPGDRVLVVLPRVPQWWLINIACIRIGAILIPGTTQLTTKDIQHRVDKSNIKCVITNSPTADKVDSIMSECPSITSRLIVKDNTDRRTGWMDFTELFNQVSADHDTLKTKSDDPMTIFFTSGTTGPPKMAEHTHASYGLGHYLTGKYLLDLTSKDIHWNMSDTGWAKSAWSNLFGPWQMGACVFVQNTPRFDPEDTLKVLESYPVSTYCTAPTAFRIMVQLPTLSKYNYKNLRSTFTAGEPLNPEVIERWFDETGQLIRQAYGQSETVLCSGIYKCIPNKSGSMGKPAPGMDLTIINDDAKEAGYDEEGDIALKINPERPLGLFTRYVDEPEKTAAAFKGDYYLTGDRGMKDEDGYFWFVGRSDDIINSAGYRIGPFEVENALIEHPAVVESAVISSPDETRGEVVKAVIVLSEKYLDADQKQLTKEIQEYVKTHTAPYKYPRKIEFVKELPKTPSSKIKRVELRNKEWGRT